MLHINTNNGSHDLSNGTVKSDESSKKSNSRIIVTQCVHMKSKSQLQGEDFIAQSTQRKTLPILKETTFVLWNVRK